MNQNEERKKRKKLAVFGVGMLMIVSAIGIGFAVNYYGSVENTDNDADAAYYVVSLDTDMDGNYDESTDFLAAFSGRIYFDTINEVSGITYTPHDAVTIAGTVCVPIKTVSVKVTGAEDLQEYDPYSLAITHGSAWANIFKMGIQIGAGSESYYDMDNTAGEGCSVNVNGAAETIFTVTLYYVCGSSSIAPPTGAMFENEVFSFTVTAAAA